MTGKLFVIEGVDSSGKATHTQKLYQRLLREKKPVKKIEFPNYQSPSSALIKMYLNGEFGIDPNDVSPYVASTFYAVDRYASYKKEWEDFYQNGGILLADRYTTSNMIHQGVKLTDSLAKNKFLAWLWEFEFKTFGLPVPDCVLFLDMPPQFSLKLMQNRVNKFTSQKEKDIHEKSAEYLISSYNNACSIAAKYKWSKVDCVNNGEIKSIDEIHEQLYSILAKYFG